MFLAVALVAPYAAVDLLGAECSGDLLDNPDYACNTGGHIRWALSFLVPLSVIAALVALLTFRD